MSICLDFNELLLLEYNIVELLSQYNLSGNLIVSTIRSPVTKFFSYIPWFDASKHAMSFGCHGGGDNHGFFCTPPRKNSSSQHKNITRC
jgi:hypothetical protein